jgi:UDP-N-acetylmuramyl pentapeptide phosphotransferase/UDP-N-acetylglucosamine-1-phosphate transferase
LAVIASAFSVSTLCIKIVRPWAAKRLLDVPNARSSHTQPTPLGGGLGVVAGVLAVAWGVLLTGLVNIPIKTLGAFSLGGGIVASAGWLDDIRWLAYKVRLAIQAICATIVLVLIGYFQSIIVPFVGRVHLYSAGILIALIWIVGLTNAYNFMDGIDGIAGGQALIAGLGWGILGLMSGQAFVGLIGLLLAASSLGFLLYNWPPARIFMGDVGSAFIGFTLATLSIVAGRVNSRFIVAGLLLVWLFVFDTSFTLLRRLVRGDNIFEAHRSHIYQRLVIAGFSHRFVTLIYIGLALIGAILALLWYLDIPFIDIIVCTIPILLFLGLWKFTVSSEARARSVT